MSTIVSSLGGERASEGSDSTCACRRSGVKLIARGGWTAPLRPRPPPQPGHRLILSAAAAGSSPYLRRIQRIQNTVLQKILTLLKTAQRLQESCAIMRLRDLIWRSHYNRHPPIKDIKEQGASGAEQSLHYCGAYSCRGAVVGPLWEGAERELELLISLVSSPSSLSYRRADRARSYHDDMTH